MTFDNLVRRRFQVAGSTPSQVNGKLAGFGRAVSVLWRGFGEPVAFLPLIRRDFLPVTEFEVAQPAEFGRVGNSTIPKMVSGSKINAMAHPDFNGAKLAILGQGHVLTLLRDDKPDIAYPGLWDLPGGGRERDETPLETALRETLEETGLAIDPAAIRSQRVYESGTGGVHWFLVAELDGALPEPTLGDEGQAVEWTLVDTFLGRDDAIEVLQDRLRAYLNGRIWETSKAEPEDVTPCRTPTPGRAGVTHIPSWKYNAVRRAILAALSEAGREGVAFAVLPDAVRARLDPQDLAKLGSIGWHTTTVKLNMEVEGEIARVPGATPQRLMTELAVAPPFRLKGLGQPK